MQTETINTQNIMKKALLILSMLVISIMANAQGVYTSVTKMDKFDDVVWKKQVKTLISITDSTIVIETKGQKAEEYCFFEEFTTQVGSREKPANIVSDVYGYEIQYLTVKRSVIDDHNLKAQKFKNINDSIARVDGVAALLRNFQKELLDGPTVMFRTISKYHTDSFFEYETDLVWVRFKDGSRIIYNK